MEGERGRVKDEERKIDRKIEESNLWALVDRLHFKGSRTHRSVIVEGVIAGI